MNPYDALAENQMNLEVLMFFIQASDKKEHLRKLKSLFGRLKRQILTRRELEQRALYPACRRYSGIRLLLTRCRQVGLQAEKLLGQLETCRIGTSAWWTSFRKLQATILQLRKAEDEQLLSTLSNLMPKRELDTLGRHMRRLLILEEKSMTLGWRPSLV